MTKYTALTEHRKEQMRSAHRKWARNNPRTAYYKQYDEDRDYSRRLVSSSKTRARAVEIPHTITTDDFVIHKDCPICGLEMTRSKVRGGHRRSPTLDRVIPALGYVPGNVDVICKHCNSKKGDASAEELRRIADWIDSFKS